MYNFSYYQQFLSLQELSPCNKQFFTYIKFIGDLYNQIINSMSVANKILVCIFCSQVSCCFASCYDEWASTQACGLGCLRCGQCCWTVCAPICHSLTLGDFGQGMGHLVKGAKFCLYGWLVSVIAPVDGCINCIFYTKKNFESGVSGAADITQNCKFIAKKLESAFEIKGSNEPEATFKQYKP